MKQWIPYIGILIWVIVGSVYVYAEHQRVLVEIQDHKDLNQFIGTLHILDKRHSNVKCDTSRGILTCIYRDDPFNWDSAITVLNKKADSVRTYQETKKRKHETEWSNFFWSFM